MEQIAELVKPRVLVAFYMADGSTARSRYVHDGAPPGWLAKTWKTRSLLPREPGTSWPWTSIAAETDSTMDTFIVPQHVIAVRAGKKLDLAGVA